MFPLLKTGRIIEKKSGKISLAERKTGRVIKRFDKQGIKVNIYDKLPCFADSRIEKKGDKLEKAINFNGAILKVLDRIDPIAKELLFNLVFSYEKQLLSGKLEQQAFEKLFSLYDSLSEKEKNILLDALESPEIDPGNTFRDFMISYPVSEACEKSRLKALLKAGILIDIPYDRKRAYEVEKKFESDLPSLRLETLNILSNTYEPSVDAMNAERVFKHCLENNKRLLVCRFGRAFYTDALLIADSKGIKSDEIRKDISFLSRKAEKLFGLDDALKLGGELQSVVNLAVADWLPLAGITGAVTKLKQALRNLELSLIEEFDKTHEIKRITEARSVIDEFRSSIHRLEQRVEEADKFEPVFVSFISRIHELDAVNIVRVNELLDPFFGENPKMEALITATGHNSTISPNPGAWLPYASDWVEALPAYAHYVIIPSNNGGYRVVALTEREILEIIYKTSADDWAKNIEDVINRENVSVARRLVALKAGNKSDSEESIISFTGCVACLIEKMADRQHRKLAKLQEQGYSRYMAVLKLAGSLNWSLSELKESSRSRFYASLACEKKRDLPNVNVLTTLGPTETETNISNWLEEAMTLYLIERKHGLENEVRKRMDFYRDSIGDMALKVVMQEEMEGELLRIMGEQGLKDEEINRKRTSIILCSLYPEIAYNTNEKIAYEFQVYGKSCCGLRDYIGPLARFTARREVIREKGLAKLIDDGRYRFQSSGPYKRYNLAYTPSRVDLGPEIIESVQNVPKWVGGDGHEAAKAVKSLYSLFNVAGVTSVDRSRTAEFLKVGENFFTRGGVYYLSLTAGSNINTLGIGDFEFLRGEWNKRGDRTVLPAGETYGGFCVPKEFSLLFAIITRALNPETVNEIFDGFGIPKDESIRTKLIKDMLHVLKLRRHITDPLEWEEKAKAYLDSIYSEYMPRLPQLAVTLNKAGVLYEDSETHNSYVITNWKNKKALGLEEINRSGVFDKVRVINLLVKESNVSIDKLTGVISAGYKEDVTDVRFSAGARKLELFSGLALHLLEDIDPEGREIYERILFSYASPMDIRLVGLCTAKDMFGHVPMDFSKFSGRARETFLQAGYSDEWIERNAEEHGLDLDNWQWKNRKDQKRVSIHIDHTLPFLVYGNNLAQISEAIKKRFLKYGLTEETVNANAFSFGGDITQWKGFDNNNDNDNEKDKKRLIKEIGDLKHIFITEARGIYSKERYEAALTGADFVDLGIPDKELLDLIEDLPRLIYLMKNGKDKPLYFADGTSGARRFVFSFRYASAKEKVKELFAIHENSFYGCMGIAKEEISIWKEEMVREREQTRKLLSFIMERRSEEADEQFQNIVRSLRDREKDEEYIRQEINASHFGVWKPYYRFASKRISEILKGKSLKDLDFGSFLIIGGRWLLNGKVSRQELEQIREDYEYVLKQKTGQKGMLEIIEHCFKPEYIPEEEEYKEVSTGVSGSLKAVEELALKLETREIRRKQLEAAQRLNRRRKTFQKEIVKPIEGIEQDYSSALSRISPQNINEEKFGAFIGLCKKVWQEIFEKFIGDENYKNECLQELDSTFRGGSLLDAEYASLEIKGSKIFEMVDRSEADMGKVAKALELLDIAFLIEKVMDAEKGEAVWKAIARFFDSTLNNHIFDYIPYHYHSERTSAFKDWSREKMIEFACKHHRFLHRLILGILKERSDLSEKPVHYSDLLLGKFDAESALVTPAVGVNAKTELEQQWFSYARLRDLSTLVFDGYPLPEIDEDVQIDDGINVGIVYPIGNTTVSVALEQCPKLRSEGINLFLVPFPDIIDKIDKNDSKFLIAKEIFFRDKKGSWVLARLKKCLVVHAVWFHFTHFLRPEIEKVGAPLIQPLLWEAATYLKCDLPGMIKGSGISCPDQRNWYKKQSEQLVQEQAKEKIKEKIDKLIHSMAAKHNVLIVKAEKESGGRRSLILPVVDKNGGRILGNINELSELIYEISQTDNAVIQEVIPSKVRQLYSGEFLELLRERFITELGIGIQEDTPFFSYFRLIVMKNPDNSYTITHRITVVSTAGIANVGQGGRLFEYRDEKINPKYRKDLREELERAAFSTLKSQEKFIKANRKRILESYLEVHDEFSFDKEILKPHSNLLGRADHEILFEMGDYMCVLLVDSCDRLMKVYDHERERFISLIRPNSKLKVYDEKGKLQALPVKLYEGSKKRKLFWQYLDEEKKPVKSLAVVKIEPNPGAGLWRPHNDRLKLAGRDGEGVYKIFKILSEWGKLYKEKIM